MVKERQLTHEEGVLGKIRTTNGGRVEVGSDNRRTRVGAGIIVVSDCAPLDIGKQ